MIQDDQSVKLMGDIVWMRHDALSLVEHLNRPEIHKQEWWKLLVARLDTMERWGRTLKFIEYEEVKDDHASRGSSSAGL